MIESFVGSVASAFSSGITTLGKTCTDPMIKDGEAEEMVLPRPGMEERSLAGYDAVVVLGDIPRAECSSVEATPRDPTLRAEDAPCQEEADPVDGLLGKRLQRNPSSSSTKSTQATSCKEDKEDAGPAHSLMFGQGLQRDTSSSSTKSTQATSCKEDKEDAEPAHSLMLGQGLQRDTSSSSTKSTQVSMCDVPRQANLESPIAAFVEVASLADMEGPFERKGAGMLGFLTNATYGELSNGVLSVYDVHHGGERDLLEAEPLGNRYDVHRTSPLTWRLVAQGPTQQAFDFLWCVEDPEVADAWCQALEAACTLPE